MLMLVSCVFCVLVRAAAFSTLVIAAMVISRPKYSSR
jgi:hypothetical protein